MNKHTVEKTRTMVMMSAVIAIMMVMTLIPFLGYIPLGFMNATILHVPVIIGAIMFGPKNGAVLGFVFGLSSLCKNTFLSPNPTSFVFSPFISTGIFHGNFGSLVICFLPRILIGVVAYYTYTAIMKWGSQTKRSQFAALSIAGVCGSLTNTLLVMNLIYFFFGKNYAQASMESGSALFTQAAIASKGIYGIIIGIIGAQGVPEAIVAGVLTAAICKIMLSIYKK